MERPDEFDALLQSRIFEAERADFAESIIARALRIEQRQPLTLLESLRRIFAELIPAKPIYAFAGLIVMGFVLGMQLDDNNWFSNGSSAPMQSLYSDDGGY